MASAIHRCQHCGYETDLSSNLAVFEDNPHCRQCGLSAHESDIKMQDDLINMMARTLQLGPFPHDQHDMSTPPTPQVLPEPAPITYISQHYHHSAHQVPANDLPVSTILENCGINAAALFPSQLQLFKNAEPDQRLRLIELWQIAPPTYGNQMHPDDLADWPQSSMEKEVEAAKYRLERIEQGKFQTFGLPGHSARNNAEPYILQGYNPLPDDGGKEVAVEDGAVRTGADYNQSTDPAYKSREWWKFSEEAEPMEHQYGMLQQMYGFLDYTSSRPNDGDAEMS
ncbi:hypothetical protein A1O1_09066 [Capronia coronata CBS 617.96]|uniref:Uncharacterized protein n=1 Tax=Capronia coronata CBS 617.96 TaxID=1182541 RepID=W9XMV4_9EURO|nr:uncharacterized protein A1O1_09066 [Capronia coronata CBS 617.96]EXJ78665.1 hypothetical protein A1O1_09066 [Capronia coronata CBS 617.96]